MLTRLPKLMNKLKETEKLEIKTTSANYLKPEHFKLLVEHAAIMTTGKGKSEFAKYIEILERSLVLFFSIGIFDEFYFNKELVAFKYSLIINKSYTCFQWYSTEKVRRSMLYFEAIKKGLQRSIADPNVDYFNILYTSLVIASHLI